MISVLVADDEAVVRAGMTLLLRQEPDLDVVAEAADGAAAVELARRHRPDVVVLDVRMPGLDGVEAARQLAADIEGPAVLMVTTFHEDEAAHRALRGGARGFLLKHAAPAELCAAVRRIAAGDGWIDPAVAPGLIDAMAAMPEPVACRPALLAALTDREREVLALLARGLTNAEIAATLVLSLTTVKTHVAHITFKTGCRDRSGAVVLAYESGLIRSRA